VTWTAQKDEDEDADREWRWALAVTVVGGALGVLAAVAEPLTYWALRRIDRQARLAAAEALGAAFEDDEVEDDEEDE
jgi:hypothetical protein